MINQGDNHIPNSDSPMKPNQNGNNYRPTQNVNYLNNDVNEVVQNHQQYYNPIQYNQQPQGLPPQQQNFYQQPYNNDLPPQQYQQPYQHAVSPSQQIPDEHLDEKKRRELEAKREELRRRKQQNQEKQHSGHHQYYSNDVYLFYYAPEPVAPQQVVVENPHECEGHQVQNFNAQANAQHVALSVQPSSYCCCGVYKRSDPCSLWWFHSCWDLLSCPFKFIQFVIKTFYECTFKGLCSICCESCTKHIDSCARDFTRDVEKKATDVQNFCSTECIGGCTCLNFNFFNCLQKRCNIKCSCETCDSPKKCWDGNTKDCCAATGTCGQIYDCCCGGNIFMTIFQFIFDCCGEIFKFLGSICEMLLNVIQYIATCQCLDGLGDCICSAFDCSCSACDDCGNCDCGGCDCGDCDCGGCDCGGCDLGGCL